MLVPWTVVLVAAVVVGFVTSALRIWIDRVFLVIILITLGHVPVGEAIALNVLVLLLASLSHGFIRREGWIWGAFGRFPSWEGWAAVLAGFAGGVLGWAGGRSLPGNVLLGAIGLYAVLMAIRLVVVKPRQGRPRTGHPAWILPIALGAGALTGLISAGGKPFAVPLYNRALGHHWPVAYAIATFGTIGAALGAASTQLAMNGYGVPEMVTALASWAGISLVAWLTDRIWSPRLMTITAVAVALALALVGVRFSLAAF